MSRTKRFLIAMGLTLFVISARGCVVWDGPYEGYVRDKETGEPISGAVVAVFWYRHTPGGMHDAVTFFGAQEDVTDEEGAFTIPGQLSINVIPFSKVGGANFKVYATGYTPCSGYTARSKDDCGYPTARLRPRQAGERPRRVYAIMGRWDNPRDWVPKFEKLMDKDQRTLGASNSSSKGDSPQWTPSSSSSSAY